MNDKFNGTTFFEIIVSGNKPGDLTNPEILIAIDEMNAFLKAKYPQIKKVVSFTDFIKKLNKELNYKGAAYYEIPNDPSKYPVESQAHQTLIMNRMLHTAHIC